MIVKTINPERYQQLVNDAGKAAFSGWDFPWLKGRMIQDEPPWDYPALVRKHINNATNMLDMGTGGGELLSSLAPLPLDTHATEVYPPNQQLAQERLSPLGVEVHNIDEHHPMPFEDSRFDLVINRRESFDSVELARVLKPQGFFITQQVGGLDNLESNQVLEDKLSFPFTYWSLAKALTDLYNEGLFVDRAEKAALRSIFKDIGAVVYYLKAIPWQVVGFDPETYHERLVKIHNIIEREGQFVATAHRFLILARKMEVK
jgi:SAM-dependent methyltransferase